MGLSVKFFIWILKWKILQYCVPSYIVVYCGIFCHTLYSQNITDSAITAVKDMQVDTVDNVTVKIKRLDNNYIYEAE